MAPQAPITRRLLRLKPAAVYLSISCAAVRRLVQRGELAIVRLTDHGPWLLDVRDLDAWIDRKKEIV